MCVLVNVESEYISGEGELNHLIMGTNTLGNPFLKILVEENTVPDRGAIRRHTTLRVLAHFRVMHTAFTSIPAQ